MALAEPDPVAVLAHLADQLPISIERTLVETAIGLAPPGSDRAMLVLGALARDEPCVGGSSS